MSKPNRGCYAFGPFYLDPRERLLIREKEVVSLTPKTFDILVLLVENKGHLVTKEDLMKGVWADAFVEEGNISYNMSMLRKALGKTPSGGEYIETVPRCGFRFVAAVTKVVTEEVRLVPGEQTGSSAMSEGEGGFRFQSRTLQREDFEPVGGAILLDSRFYVVRPADADFEAAVARGDSIVLVKGPRQVGKTSLLARGLQQAREVGAKVVATDLEMLGASELESSQALFMALGKSIAEQLELGVSPRSTWEPEDGANANFGRFLRRAVLDRIEGPLVWGLDEVDRLFSCSFGSEVFALFRFWHNNRALDPGGPWRRLTLAIAYATEAHLFIANMNQSPFNVGTTVALEDFTVEQVEDLNGRYGSPLRDREEVARFFALVGGHPYLVRAGLDAIAHGISLETLEAQADRGEGLLGNHLRRMLLLLERDPGLCEALRGVLQGEPNLSRESFYRLRSAGVLTGDSRMSAKPRCRLYARYLERHCQSKPTH
jgi:DNA-binding winged helix-turn-helix (wHTH) protein